MFKIYLHQRSILYTIAIFFIALFLFVSPLLFSSDAMADTQSNSDVELKCSSVDIDKDLPHDFINQTPEPFLGRDGISPQFTSIQVQNFNANYAITATPFLVLYSDDHQESLTGIPVHVQKIDTGTVTLDPRSTKTLLIDMTPVAQTVVSGSYVGYVHFSYQKTADAVLPEIVRYTPRFLTQPGYQMVIESDNETPVSWLRVDEAVFEDTTASEQGVLPLSFLQQDEPKVLFRLSNSNETAGIKGDVDVVLYRGVEPQEGVRILSQSRPYHLVPNRQIEYDVSLQIPGELDSAVYSLLVKARPEEGEERIIGHYIFAQDGDSVYRAVNEQFRVSYMDTDRHYPLACWAIPSIPFVEAGTYVDELFPSFATLQAYNSSDGTTRIVKQSALPRFERDIQYVPVVGDGPLGHDEILSSSIQLLHEQGDTLYTYTSVELADCASHPHLCMTPKMQQTTSIALFLLALAFVIATPLGLLYLYRLVRYRRLSRLD